MSMAHSSLCFLKSTCSNIARHRSLVLEARRRLLTCSPSRSSSSSKWLGERLGRIAKELDDDDDDYERNNQRNTESENAPSMRNEESCDAHSNITSATLDISHPWPQWISLIDSLVHANYFAPQTETCSSRNHNKGLFGDSLDEIFLSNKDKNLLALTRAFANFGRNRPDLIKHLSRRDIQIIVESGCPNVNPKVVASAKRLRAYVHVEEGDVCSKCSLRGSCTMPYAIPSQKETARTIDVLRILFMYGYVPQAPSLDGSQGIKKLTKEAVRRLVSQLVELSRIPLDPDHLNSQHVQQKLGCDDIEMKKGDWLCHECEFMNFAKNKRCLRCTEPAPRRKLKPGEWECLGCGYVNYRRNMVCYKCESNRPQESNGFRSSCSSDDGAGFQRYREWKWKKQMNVEGSCDGSKAPSLIDIDCNFEEVEEQLSVDKELETVKRRMRIISNRE